MGIRKCSRQALEMLTDSVIFLGERQKNGTVKILVPLLFLIKIYSSFCATSCGRHALEMLTDSVMGERQKKSVKKLVPFLFLIKRYSSFCATSS